MEEQLSKFLGEWVMVTLGTIIPGILVFLFQRSVKKSDEKHQVLINSLNQMEHRLLERDDALKNGLNRVESTFITFRDDIEQRLRYLELNKTSKEDIAELRQLIISIIKDR
jgi:hypothetical protein